MTSGVERLVIKKGCPYCGEDIIEQGRQLNNDRPDQFRCLVCNRYVLLKNGVPRVGG